MYSFSVKKIFLAKIFSSFVFKINTDKHFASKWSYLTTAMKNQKLLKYDHIVIYKKYTTPLLYLWDVG